MKHPRPIVYTSKQTTYTEAVYLYNKYCVSGVLKHGVILHRQNPKNASKGQEPIFIERKRILDN